MKHILKCDKEIYDRVKSGEKTFDIRKDDRHFQSGDTVVLDPNKNTMPGGFASPPIPAGYEDRPLLEFKIGFVLRGGQYGLEPGYVAFSIFPNYPDCANPGDWITHDGSNYTPPGAISCSVIEVVSNGNTRDNSLSINPSNVKWHNIKEWRHAK